MESGDVGSRRADCGSAVAVVCDVTALLPLTGNFVSSGSVPFIRDVTVTEVFAFQDIEDKSIGSPDLIGLLSVRGCSSRLGRRCWLHRGSTCSDSDGRSGYRLERTYRRYLVMWSDVLLRDTEITALLTALSL
jgi:hypothetical protein